jgi:hypothetical protein
LYETFVPRIDLYTPGVVLRTMSKKKKEPQGRWLATADPKLVIFYLDSGWTAHQWAGIAEMTSRLIPDPTEPNVFPRLKAPPLAVQRQLF